MGGVPFARCEVWAFNVDRRHRTAELQTDKAMMKELDIQLILCGDAFPLAPAALEAWLWE
eukprot:COSAG04_NODE_2381_length_4233_cov_38.831640_3_plen_60_part_00